MIHFNYSESLAITEMLTFTIYNMGLVPRYLFALPKPSSPYFLLCNNFIFIPYLDRNVIAGSNLILVSANNELRRSIHKHILESKLLGAIGHAEMEKETQKTVKQVNRDKYGLEKEGEVNIRQLLVTDYCNLHILGSRSSILLIN
jgi:hypothetical protein